ncbi:dihydrofolate reductase family protein [Chitinophaga sp. sic0106]|uniref:dihydrofolate reductase family protein n=1 Tax=Chitinophaga sp. sic0106 TaxID=2854785 RepID=UPI001C475D2D|nr:dihydrofolate reductase family protein [Chitinophaga sp. sic0106]MBV7533722.1 dihydrofolate reductase family protein [Chitinophaga sp. sic0106]
MRHLIYGINLTIDGYCEHTQLPGSAEIHEYFTDLLAKTDLAIYGRKTYDLMVPYWPDVAKAPTGDKAIDRFAQIFNGIEKIVCSRTRTDFEGNPRVLHDNLTEQIMALKQAPGKDISIGGVTLPGELIKLGLVDEFYFVVHPVLGGQGRKLLDGANLPEQLSLTLADATTLASGCMALHYVKQ